jgi:hypothetical protein
VLPVRLLPLDTCLGPQQALLADAAYRRLSRAALPAQTIATPSTAQHRAATHTTPLRTWSPSTGAPRLFIATRIWCVRPVSGFNKKARSPGRLPGMPAVVNRVTAGSAPPRVSSQLPRRPFAISPTTLPIFLAGRLSDRAT